LLYQIVFYLLHKRRQELALKVFYLIDCFFRSSSIKVCSLDTMLNALPTHLHLGLGSGDALMDYTAGHDKEPFLPKQALGMNNQLSFVELVEGCIRWAMYNQEESPQIKEKARVEDASFIGARDAEIAARIAFDLKERERTEAHAQDECQCMGRLQNICTCHHNCKCINRFVMPYDAVAQVNPFTSTPPMQRDMRTFGVNSHERDILVKIMIPLLQRLDPSNSRATPELIDACITNTHFFDENVLSMWKRRVLAYEPFRNTIWGGAIPRAGFRRGQRRNPQRRHPQQGQGGQSPSQEQETQGQFPHDSDDDDDEDEDDDEEEEEEDEEGQEQQTHGLDQRFAAAQWPPEQDPRLLQQQLQHHHQQQPGVQPDYYAGQVTHETGEVDQEEEQEEQEEEQDNPPTVDIQKEDKI